MAGKKKQVKKVQKKKEFMLTEALTDITKELENLRKQKELLETKLKNIGSSVIITQVEESKLREQISSLVGKEGTLTRKRNKLKEKSEELKTKIAKVSKIKDELGEV